MKAALIAMLDVNNMPRYVRSVLALGLLAAFVYEIHLGNELAGHRPGAVDRSRDHVLFREGSRRRRAVAGDGRWPT